MGDVTPVMGQTNAASAIAVVTNLRRSWAFDPEAAGRRAVQKHGEALRRLADTDDAR